MTNSPRLNKSAAPMTSSVRGSGETAMTSGGPGSHTQLKQNAFGVPTILFFVFSAQAPLTGIVGTAALTIALGVGAGTPGIYLLVGASIILFAVGFTTIARVIDTGGGFFAVVKAGFGRRAGTSAASLALLSYNAVQFGMYALLGVSVSHLLQSDLQVNVPWWAGALVSIVLVWLLGSFNIELGAKILAVLVTVEFVLLIAMAIGILGRIGVDHLDFGASFGLHSVLVGAPGVGIIFAIASMFGFESTAIYAPEAKNPARTVPRATYLSVSIISLFFTLIVWMLVSYYGTAAVQDAAGQSLAGDPAQFVLVPMTDVLGAWSSPVAQILLCTSLFAGVLAFHNMVTRYLHALGQDGILPRSTAHTNRWKAPWVASLAQSVLAVVTITVFAGGGLNPMTTLFTWASGISVLALVVLYVLTSLAIVCYFRRNPQQGRRWNVLIAPALSVVVMAGVVLAIVGNFESLVGSAGPLMWTLIAVVPIVAGAGYLAGSRSSPTQLVPEVLDTP